MRPPAPTAPTNIRPSGWGETIAQIVVLALVTLAGTLPAAQMERQAADLNLEAAELNFETGMRVHDPAPATAVAPRLVPLGTLRGWD